MPRSLDFNYSYRSALRVWYRCQVLTRITLALHYVDSFRVLIVYTRDVDFRSYFRYLHANMPSFFLAFVFLHVGRGLYYGSSDKMFLWISRVIMRVSFMGVAFLRYVLPYGQMSYWGATVIINLLSVVSYQVCVLLWRRFVVSEYTVTRFYVLHFLIPLALAILVLGHLYLLHLNERSFLLRFFQEIFSIRRHILMWSVCCMGATALVEFHANIVRDLEHSTHIPKDIKPEWILLLVYAIMRFTRDNSNVALTLASAEYLLFVCHINFTLVGIFVYVFTFLIVCIRLFITLYYGFSYQVLKFIIFLEFLFMNYDILYLVI